MASFVGWDKPVAASAIAYLPWASTPAQPLITGALISRHRPEPPSEPPSTDVYRQIINDLIAVYDGHKRVTVGRAKHNKLLALHGFIAHVVEQTSAALALIDAGMTTQAAANVRVAYEYALTTQWVHFSDEGVDKLVDFTQRNTTALFNSAEKTKLAIPSDLRDAFAGQRPPSIEPELRHFEQLCQRFDPTGWLYVIYRLLSAHAHPSAQTAISYLDMRTTPPGMLRSAPAESRPLIFTLALSVALAVGVHEDLVKGKPNKAKVRDIAARGGLVTLLTLDPPVPGTHE